MPLLFDWGCRRNPRFCDNFAAVQQLDLDGRPYEQLISSSVHLNRLLLSGQKNENTTDDHNHTPARPPQSVQNQAPDRGIMSIIHRANGHVHVRCPAVLIYLLDLSLSRPAGFAEAVESVHGFVGTVFVFPDHVVVVASPAGRDPLPADVSISVWR